MTNHSTFAYRSFEIGEILQQDKKSADSDPKPKVNGASLSLDQRLYMAGGSKFVLMRVSFNAGRKELPSSYRAAFMLDQQRVRGVDYQEVAVKRRYKIHIPKGWHQNLIDPNLEPGDPNQNRHEALSWTIGDFDGFIRHVCGIWNIDLGREEGLL